ncbi:O-methyltransferase-like protein family 3 [Xylariomycetidae sp. FL2044]|nr:O-methyltransferase-like protein family 3 [Xylariomycetidae sp. FL2044]
MSAHVFYNDTNNFSEEVCSRIFSADKFISNCVIPKDPALDSALKANAAAELDNIDVAPNQGKLFYLLAKLVSAKNILEVGTLGGYSAIWFSKALPEDGKLVTLEIEPKHARVAEANIKNAGFEHKVQVRVGPALDTLRNMEDEGWGVGKENGAFDLVFIDADKIHNWDYVEYGLKFGRVGTVIIVDNVGRQGRIGDPTFTEGGQGANVVGARRVIEMMGKDKRLDATVLQTLGVKGWDGFAMAVVGSL